MRPIFIKTLIELAREDKNIYLLTADLGFSVVEDFQKEFPERYMNVGIAEQNLMGVAAGLALSGKKVFVYTIASFATFRCFEQIRNDISYHNLNVIIVGVGAGLSYPTFGLTHQTESDVALMRSIPNMTVICPGDPSEVKAAVMQSIELKGPAYIRIAKRGEPILHTKIDEFKIGRGIVIKDFGDVAIISSGHTLKLSKDVSEELEIHGIKSMLVSMHTIKPIDKELILDIIRNKKFIFTIEEHSIIGGLGSAVAEIIAESNLNKNIIFKRIGIDDKFCSISGDSEFIRDYFNMSKDKILNEIELTVKVNNGTK